MYLVTCYKMHTWLCCVAGVVIVVLSCRQVWCRTVGFSRAVHHFSFAHGTEQETCLTQLSCLSPLSFHNKGSSFTVFGKSLPVLFVSIRFESEWGKKASSGESDEHFPHLWFGQMWFKPSEGKILYALYSRSCKRIKPRLQTCCQRLRASIVLSSWAALLSVTAPRDEL